MLEYIQSTAPERTKKEKYKDRVNNFLFYSYLFYYFYYFLHYLPGEWISNAC